MITANVGRGLCLPVHRTTLAGTAARAVPATSVYQPCRRFASVGRAQLSTTASMGPVKPQALVPAAALIHSSSFGSTSSCLPTMWKPANTGLLPTSPASRRHISSSERRPSTIVDHPDTMPLPPPTFAEATSRAAGPLSVLPLSMILRSLATNTVSASPVLLPPSLRIMASLAHSINPFLSPDRNPLLRFFLKQTFYAQFCAGENSVEVRRTIGNLRGIGFTGVILAYAREVVLSEAQTNDLGKEGVETEECIRNEIAPWAEGTLETVRLASEGDFVGLKFTGAGRLALYQLRNRLPCSPYLAEAIDSICQLAHQRGVRLLFDAEQDVLQDGIDDWFLRYARKYNKDAGQKPIIYNTYQAYKKCMPEVISRHLAQAKEEGFTLGVKLVRGAYLGSDPRHRLHDTKEDTDACFDGIAASVLARQWNATVSGQGEFPPSAIVLATHNADSVRRARAICDAGAAKSPVAFAQLQGMADEVSCELVEAGNQSRAKAASPSVAAAALPAYKYLVWGSTGECMKYLLRRAQENKDAVGRTKSGRDAMWAELVRRFKVTVGLAS